MSILMLTSAIIFMFTNHPLSMGLILLIQTTLVAAFTSLLSNSSWFSYILFIIMIGGMLVLFIYMTSIASNKKFKTSLPLMIFFNIMISIYILMKMFIDEWMNHLMFLSDDLISKDSMNLIPMIKFINYPMSIITILLIIYLLITLIAVVNITMVPYGPLRKSN
uniref:NADH dehydrogenase subunit 6 n=1 Tax=Sinelater perroti TaxID=1028068 RepID=UPI002113C3F2|nr:NADH dehydrogenase subunit 6 [Sinelater perroti]UTS56941.1 NADH dehydrogenase subunit 6 [Sinelater perroti]